MLAELVSLVFAAHCSRGGVINRRNRQSKLSLLFRHLHQVR